ncbi:MAG: DUF6171 family protein [Lachnospiraceae bacterium]|nr:DUF6171 family protein [Lachnospiraceae bacterium]
MNASEKNSNNRNLRVCKKCLLRDLPEQEAYATLFLYLKNLPSEDKVPDEVYDERLAICRGCDRLLAGTCMLCGCYVELRAAMRVRGCPDVPARWGAWHGEEDA